MPAIGTIQPKSRSRNGTRDRRAVTVKEVALAVGLSQPAVSQVLNGTGQIAPLTRERVLAVAEKMGYRRNAAARAVVTRKTRQVGVLVLNSPDDPATFPLAYLTMLGMNMALEADGYVLCLVRLGDVEQSVEGHSRVFREHVLDGVIVTTQLPAHVTERIQELVPVCVWADTNVWRETHCVRRHEVNVGRTIGEAATRAGYEKVIYLTELLGATDLPSHYSDSDRGTGIADACGVAGVAFETMRFDWSWTPQFSAELVARLGPDVAVVATDPFRARMVQQTAAVNGLRIGDDFGLACCDISGDVRFNWPALAGMLFNRIELGKIAAQLMLAALEHGEAQPASVSLPGVWHPGTTLQRKR